MTVYGGNYQGWSDWKPSYLPDDKCKFWVESLSADSFELSGSDVMTWYDKSIYGNDFTQVSGSRPTWDGTKVLFTATPDTYLECAMSFPNLSEWEYYRVTQLSGGVHYYPLHQTTNPKRLWDYHASSSPDGLRLYLNDQYSTPYPTGTSATAEVKGITQTVMNTDEQYSIMKGYRADYTSVSSDLTLYLDDTTYMNGHSGGSNFYDYNAWELIITSRLSVGERNAMMQYLRLKHNVKV